MLKAVERLVLANCKKRVGNHATYFSQNCEMQYFTYFDNIICTVDWMHKKVYLTDAGYDTPSTNRTVNDYKRWFSNKRNFAPGIVFEIIDQRPRFKDINFN